MEEIINNLKNFVEERNNLKQQINDIENKRNELAQERNEKKAKNKINNNDEVWAEVNCLGKQIYDLGEQSQWFQRQLDMKLIGLKEQLYLQIDNLIAEEVRKTRIITSQVEELGIYSSQMKIFAELTNQINLTKQRTEMCFKIKKMVKKGQINETIKFITNPSDTTEKSKENIVEKVQGNVVENEITEHKVEEVEKIEEVAPNITELCIEEFSPEELIVENFDVEPLVVEEFKEETVENEETITEISNEENIVEENKEQEIIFCDDENVKTFENEENDTNVTIKNIVAKIEDGELVYKAEISDGTSIKIYPIKEGLYKKDKIEREGWKNLLIRYSADAYVELDNSAVKKMDIVVSELFERFATKYDQDMQNTIYNYVMSFSENGEYDTTILPSITYNFAYIDELKISKVEEKMLQKNIKNSSKNSAIEVVGKTKKTSKLKYIIKKLLKINTPKALPVVED